MGSTKRAALASSAIAIGLLTWMLMPGSSPTSEAGALSNDGRSEKPNGSISMIRLPEFLSQEAQIGKEIFDAVCASCHGESAIGTEGKGPPLVHKIYEPSHHSDIAFLLAVRNGVRAHHWRFGSMPPQEGLTDAEIRAIVKYVRELQQENGIF